MSSDKSQKTSMENFLDSYLQDLLAMSDKDVLNDIEPASLKAEALRMLESAKTIAGKQRLASARERMASTPRTVSERLQNVSIAEARAYLKKAANDPRFTLAARELSEMSDEDVITLYQQICLLEEPDGNNSGGA